MTIQIRPEQINAFQVSAIENFIDSVVPHLREFFPETCADLGEPDTRAVVRLGIEMAQSYGIDREVFFCEFVDLIFLFGIDFDKDPALPWASEILLDESIQDQLALMDHLWEAGLAEIANQPAL